jgi:transposase-like protein
MSYKVLNDAVEQYRTDEQNLADAAAAAGVSPTELAAELRRQGVSLRESDEASATATRY